MISRRHALLTLAAAACLPARAGSRARVVMLLTGPEGPAETAFINQLAVDGVSATIILRNLAAERSGVADAVRAARLHGADLVYVADARLAAAMADVDDLPLIVIGSGGARRRHVARVNDSVPLQRQMETALAYRAFTRIATIADPSDADAMRLTEELRRYAAGHGLTLIERQLPLFDDGTPIPSAVPELVAAVARQRAELLYLGRHSFLTRYRKLATSSALDAGLPCFAADELLLRDGQALFGLVAERSAVGRCAAHQAMRILRGAAPESLPVATLSRPTCIVNMRVAAKLSCYPPVGLLATALILH